MKKPKIEMEYVSLQLDQMEVTPTWGQVGPNAFINELTGKILAENLEDDTDDDVEVGRIEAQYIRLGSACNNGIRWFDVLDCHTADLAAYIGLLAENEDHFSPFVLDQFEVEYSDLLVLNRIRIEPKYRGHGYGLYAAHLMMEGFGGEALVACQPAPYELSSADERTSPEWKAGQAKLRAYWSRLGFKRVGKSLTFALSLMYKRPSIENVIERYLTRHKTEVTLACR